VSEFGASGLLEMLRPLRPRAEKFRTTADHGKTQAEVHGNRTDAVNAGDDANSYSDGAPDGAPHADSGVNEGDPMLTIEAWASLSEQQREAILAIIRGSK